MTEQIFRKNIEKHKALLSDFETYAPGILAAMATLIAETFEKGGCLYLCGNGGSASDAQHVAGEFIGRFRSERRPLPAIALNTDTSVITCIGNDYAFADIFARQVQALVKEKDVLWAFSTSGNSPNILAAADSAKRNKAGVIAFTAMENSHLEKKADLCLCIGSSVVSSSQEMHQLAYHIICDLVEDQIMNSK
jgi:D-sedoheptulose 7-phosphate isomerase